MRYTPYRTELELNLDVGPVDCDRVGLHAGRRVVDASARCDVVSPIMPGAHDYLPVQIALSERTATVNTFIVECIVGTVDVEDGERFSACFNRCAAAGLDVCDACDSYEFRHVCAF